SIDANATVVLVAADDDGITVITDELARFAPGSVSSVQVISHGAAGELQLGRQLINQEHLQSRASQLAQWSGSLTRDADVLIYGCDVAAGEIGKRFTDKFASLTGADVAASTNRTGNDPVDSMRSDWVLERSTGRIESALALSGEVLATYAHTLNIVVNAWGQTGDEVFRLKVDNVAVGTYGVDQTWTPITYETTEAIDASRVSIEFINDLYDPDNGIDRNLFVNNIQINGNNFETNSPDVYSTGAWTAADGIQPGYGRGIVLNGNGYFQYGANSSTDTTLEVFARGDEGTEQFRIEIDGRRIGEAFYTVDTTMQSFSIRSDDPITADQVRILFLNDQYDPANGIDSNLTVDRIAINGQSFQTEAADTLASGVYVAGTGITDGFLQTETLQANGYFQFKATTQGDGDIVDRNFGNGGIASLDNITTTVPAGEVAVNEASGQFLVQQRNGLTLFDSSGNRVSTFGSGGTVALASIVSLPDADAIFDLHATADGGWLVAADGSGANDNALVKLNQSGQVVTTFRGSASLNTLGMTNESVAIEVLSNGKVLVAGSGSVARLNANGTVDSTYGVAGKAAISGGTVDGVFANSDGSVLVGTDAGAGSIRISKVLANGQRDLAYGSSGTRLVSLPDARVAKFTVDSRGRAIVTGPAYVVDPVTFSGQYSSKVVRLTASGNLDASFGNGGTVEAYQRFIVDDRGFSYSTVGRGAFDVVVDAQDRIVIKQSQEFRNGAASYRNDGTLFVRLNTNGSFDSSLSDDGAELVSEFSSEGQLTPDGRGGYLLIGYTNNFFQPKLTRVVV
ncbi:MAG: DUF4347 domain-containing protein, partial [Rubripirellula sp.]